MISKLYNIIQERRDKQDKETQVRGYNWAAGNLLLGKSVEDVQAYVDKSKECDYYTEFDKGIESAIFDYKEKVGYTPNKIGFSFTVGGFIELADDEIEAFEDAMTDNRFERFEDRFERTHYESQVWSENQNGSLAMDNIATTKTGRS